MKGFLKLFILLVQQDTVALNEKAMQLHMYGKTFAFTIQANAQLDVVFQHCTDMCLKLGEYVRTDF